MRALSLTIPVQTCGGHQPVTIPACIELRAKNRVHFPALGRFKLPLVVVDSPYQLTVGDSFQVLDSLFLFTVRVGLFFKLGLNILQFCFLVHDHSVEQPHVINQIALVVFGQFLSTALYKT